jgi:hypothetical protein
MKKSLWLALLGLALLALALPAVALAQPSNDNFANATVITTLPFSDTLDNTGATTEPGEPQPCNYSPQTVWYSFTPAANGVVRADMDTSSFFDRQLNLYLQLGSGFGGLSFIGCQVGGGSITFNVQAGTTYYLQASSIYSGGGSLHVNMQAVPPPPNDDFANAKTITALPYSDTEDTTAATLEPGEPTPSCGFGSPSGSVWYAFTPTTNETVSASDNGFVAAYTGTSLGSLTSLGCRAFGGMLTFHAEAGTTYYFQAGGLFGGSGSLTFNLIVTPPPVANFYFSPSDPSVFDTIQFYDNSYDPGQVGIQSQAWKFGDGTTATGCCPSHQYAKDGDYTVQLNVTTPDGRTGSTSQVVHVKTHDVAITKFSVPQSASAGQTRTITVGINSKRYPETVQVQLWKSAPGGFQQVGTLTQFVPLRPANRTTDFSFSYTFTSDDASVGKVTFEAIATIVNARDALPSDNQVIALPTKVTK